MRATKAFEIKDRQKEEAMLAHVKQDQEKKPASNKKRRSIKEDSLPASVPSYMKPTAAHTKREEAISKGEVESSHLDKQLAGPMIDASVPVTTNKPRKSSVGGFLKKKFGLGKGELFYCFIVDMGRDGIMSAVCCYSLGHRMTSFFYCLQSHCPAY